MQPATIKLIGSINYQECYQKMQDFTEARDNTTNDEIWIVEHPAIFTLGLAGKEEHILNTQHNIPILRTNRGGQVTYHGPEQIIIYTLIDLARLKLNIRQFVTSLETAIINYLTPFNIHANAKHDAPGVYVHSAKIASLGLKVRKSCTYHGLSFNFNLDKTPFSYINPCGYKDLAIVNLSDLVPVAALPSFNTTALAISAELIKLLYP